MNAVRMDMRELRALQERLKPFKKWRVKVGILGAKAERFDIESSTSTADALNNPTLGLIHEFGSKANAIPARSFLRVPLMTKLPKRLEQIGKALWRTIILKQGPEKALEQLGVQGEIEVQKAFNQGGPGWAPLSPYTVARKKKNKTAILIDSGQLKRSISSEVVKGGR